MLFDPQAIMNAAIEGVMETRRTPVPVGDYRGQITKIVPRAGQSKDGDSWVALDIFVELESDERLTKLGLERRVMKGGMMLDLTDSGGLDLGKNKNVRLGALREAVGQNIPGQVWSPTMLVGQLVTVTVKHRLDPADPSLVYDEIATFGKYW